MSTHDCIHLARILTFVRRHDHPEARIDTTLPDGPAVVWTTTGVSCATHELVYEPSLARTMTEAREELGY